MRRPRLVTALVGLSAGDHPIRHEGGGNADRTQQWFERTECEKRVQLDLRNLQRRQIDIRPLLVFDRSAEGCVRRQPAGGISQLDDQLGSLCQQQIDQPRCLAHDLKGIGSPLWIDLVVEDVGEACAEDERTSTVLLGAALPAEGVVPSMRARTDAGRIAPLHLAIALVHQRFCIAAVTNAMDASTAYLRLRNTAGFFDLAIDAAGNLAFNNYNADDAYQNTPLYFQNDGTPVFNSRPYYGSVSDDSRLITYGEANALVGGGGGTITSVFGRSGPLIDAQSGDYNSSQITHGGGSVSDVLSNSLLKAGGDMTGPLGLAGTGANYFAEGTGDGADYTTHNVKVRGHWGWAFETYDGSVSGVYDFRTGTWDVAGGYKVDGVSVVTEFDTLSGGTF